MTTDLIKKLEALTGPDVHLVMMLVKAAAFADWAAGQGICPEDGGGIESPEDFMSDYWCERNYEVEGIETHVTDRLIAILKAKEASHDA